MRYPHAKIESKWQKYWEEKGIFKTVPPKQHADSGQGAMGTDSLLSRFSHEPSIEEIRKAAIEYAEVSPDKIITWRKKAANKAWLPDLSMSETVGMVQQLFS